MSIRDSSKLKHVLAAVSVIACLYVVIDVPLARLAGWAERSAESYPWPDEDYLRFLLPTMFEDRARERIFIAGASEAREDLLYELFAEAFPAAYTYQGGVGGGNFVGLLAGMRYLDAEYGHDALPTRIVLGITPRYIANIPRTQSPVIESINKYSQHWNVSPGHGLPTLEEKSMAERMAATIRFQAKQHTRYRSAVCAAALRVLHGHKPTLEEMTDDAASSAVSPRRLQDWVEERLYFCRSPYRYHGRNVEASEAAAREWLTSPRSFWPQVHAWDPYADRAMVTAQLGALVSFAHDHGISLYVVNMPEHPQNRAQYQRGNNRRYLEVVRGAIGATPFLDLRTMLEAEDYVDHAHADLAAARRVTERAIEFIRTSDTPVATPAGHERASNRGPSTAAERG